MRLVRVGAFTDHGEAHAARGYLEAHGVNAEVSGVDETYPSASVAQVTVLAPDSEAEDARRLLAELGDQSASPTSPTNLTDLLVGGGVFLFILGLVVLMAIIS